MIPTRFPALLAALLGAVTAPVSRAQDLLHKAPPAPAPVVIQNAIVHTLDRGTLIGGTVWFEDGLIRGVFAPGEPFTPPANATLVDAATKHLYPGMIAACSQLGLIEIGAVRQTVDTDEVGDHSPEALAGVAVNPDSAAIPVARSNGVLLACVMPTGGEIPGRASVMRADGWTNADMTALADAGIVVDWPAMPEPRSRRGRRGSAPGADRDPVAATKKARERIAETFERARTWHAQRAADPTTPPDLRAESMGAALRRERPVFLLADELEEIESALAFAAEQGLGAIVVGGRDAALCADLLTARDVPVILRGIHRLPRRDDSDYDEPFRLPALLAELGVRFCIATGEEFAHERNLPYHAATAAAFGLDRERAIAAITRDAAQILGLGDRLGTITVGKEATLLLTDGSPLDLTTKVEAAWIAGRQTDLRNKQTELAQKYRAKYGQLEGR